MGKQNRKGDSRGEDEARVQCGNGEGRGGEREGKRLMGRGQSGHGAEVGCKPLGLECQAPSCTG